MAISEADCENLCPLIGASYYGFFKGRSRIAPVLTNCSQQKDSVAVDVSEATHIVPRCTRAVCGETALTRAPWMSSRACERQNRTCMV